MTPRIETVESVLLNDIHDAPAPARQAAGSALVKALGLVERPRDLRQERNYADSVASGYVTLPAGCSIPAPEPTADDLNSIWAVLAPCPLDGGFTRLLNTHAETR